MDRSLQKAMIRSICDRSRFLQFESFIHVKVGYLCLFFKQSAWHQGQDFIQDNDVNVFFHENLHVVDVVVQISGWMPQ